MLRLASRRYSTASLAVLALLLAATAGPALAQYKWKDSGGQVHVSDLPPPRDIPDKDVLQQPTRALRAAPAASAVASAAAASAPARPTVDPELEARRKRAEDEAKAKTKADEERQAAQRADNCQRARQLLALMNSGQRVTRLNDKGERIVLDDSARSDETQRAQRAIDSDCR